MLIQFIHIQNLWEYQKTLIQRHSSFIFKYHEIKYLDLANYIINNKNNDPIKIPFILRDNETNEEVAHLISKEFYQFWQKQKNNIIFTDTLKSGSFFFGGDNLYFSTLKIENKDLFIPILEKNVQFWQSAFPDISIYSEELLSLKNSIHPFFHFHLIEYRNNWLITDEKLLWDEYPRSIEAINNQDAGDYYFKIEDPGEEGHWIIIHLAFPDFIQFIAYLLKVIILSLCFILLSALLLEMIENDLFLLKTIYESVFWKNLLVNFYSLLVFFFLSYWFFLIVFNQNSKTREREFVKRKFEEVENYFQEKMEIWGYEFYGNYDQTEVLFNNPPPNLIFYYFDQEGRLDLTNSEEFLLNETILTIVERIESPISFWELIKGKLYFVHVFPVINQDVFAGMTVILYPYGCDDLLHIIEGTKIKIAPYWKEFKYSISGAESYDVNFPEMVPFLDYYNNISDMNHLTSFHQTNQQKIFFKASDFCLEKGDLIYGISFPYGQFSFGNLLNYYLIITSILIPFWFFILFLINKKLSSRIAEVVKILPAVLKGKTVHRLPVKGKDEISHLYLAVNMLVDNYEKEKKLTIQLEKERLITQLAREIAHEIKNPLTPMKLSIQHLEDVLKDNPAELIKIYPKISLRLKNNIEILNSLSERFSALAKMELDSLIPINPLLF